MIILLNLLVSLLCSTPTLHAQDDKQQYFNVLQANTDSLVLQQYQRIEPYFQEAYTLYPSLPRGILEMVAFTYSRFNHLSPDTLLREKGQIPATYGVMGLTLDGEGYFRDNLITVSQLSAIAVDKIIQSPRDNILAYAMAYHKLMQELGITSNNLAAHFPVLDSLSELPAPTSTGLKWALTNQHYAYALFINHPLFRQALHLEIPEVDIMQVFGTVTPLLQSIVNTVNIYQNTDNKDIIDVIEQNQKSIQDNNVDYSRAVWCPAGTCNYSSRNGHDISAVTIHYTQGTYSGAIAWFQNCTYNGVGARASAHYVLRSIDGQVTQMVRESDKAWHVGNCNAYTVGIEHEAYGDIASYFTPAMYQSSAHLTRDICERHNISPLRMFYRDTLDDGTVLNYGLHSLGGETSCIKIKGHQHFPDQSHTDPGPYWDWNYYFKLVNPDSPIIQYHNSTGILYDSGGPEGNYGNDERQIVTIQVDSAEAIELSFTQFELEANYDFLWIYDGATVFSPLIVRSNTVSPGTVRSSSDAITIEFRSDCATTAPGWTAVWNAIMPATQDNPPTTSIRLDEEEWVTGNFNVEFDDQDDHGIAYRFYQLLGSDGTVWSSQPERGFAWDNFDDFNADIWTVESGHWSVSNSQLDQSGTASAQIFAPLRQDLSPIYLYDFYAAARNCHPDGSLEFVFNADRSNVSHAGTAYSIAIQPYHQQVLVKRWVNGDVVMVDSVGGVYTVENVSYLYRILYERSTGKIILFRGETPLIEWQDPVPLAIPGQYVQFRTEGLSAYFDNWRVCRSRTDNTEVIVGPAPISDLPWQASNSFPLSKIKAVVVDDALQFSPFEQKELLVDYTPPVMTGSVNVDGCQGMDVIRTNQVSANWPPATDPHSGIVGYEYVIGAVSSCTTPLKVGFTSENNIIEKLKMREGEPYYIQVRALNGAGLYSTPVRSNVFLYQPYSRTSRNLLKNCYQQPQATIAPNPCKDAFSITLSALDMADKNDASSNAPNTHSSKWSEGETWLYVYDLCGRMIMKQLLLENNVRIDAKDWNSGLYIIQLWKNGNMIGVEKLIKE